MTSEILDVLPVCYEVQVLKYIMSALLQSVFSFDMPLLYNTVTSDTTSNFRCLNFIYTPFFNQITHNIVKQSGCYRQICVRVNNKQRSKIRNFVYKKNPRTTFSLFKA
jgi:hypothetical protein